MKKIIKSKFLRSARKANKVFACILLTLVMLCSCGTETNNTEVPPNIDIQETNVEDLFVTDYDIDEKNRIGNTSANLVMQSTTSGRTCGRVTGQGQWAYYFNQGEIKKINVEGFVQTICYVSDAYSLNVIGDWLYYASDTSIYKIRTDGSMQEEIISDMVKYKPFQVIDNFIYYVKANQINSSEYEYEMCKYDVEKNKVVGSLYCNNVAPILLGVYGDNLYYIYTYDGMQIVGSFIMSTMEFGGVEIEADKVTSYMNTSLLSKGILMISKSKGMFSDYSFSMKGYDLNSIFNEETAFEFTWNLERGISLKNVYNDSIIVSIGTDICRIPYDKLYNNDMDSFWAECVINEANSVGEVYVVGNYIYYIVVPSGKDIDEMPLYRVKIDGTDWRQL